MSTPKFWTAVNSMILIVSCLLLIFLFSETVYRDNYTNYKRELLSKATTPINSPQENTKINIISDVNERINKQGNATLEAAASVCETLYTDTRNKESCITKIRRVQVDEKYNITNKTYPELDKIVQNKEETEEALYMEYLKNKEIGFKLIFANQLSGPNLFIMIFLFLGLSASSIGNLVIDALNKKQGRTETSTAPLVGLLLGPVVSCVVGAVLVYVFTPNGEQQHYFAKKLLNTPIAVFISSFMLSFSPVSTIQNIASFVSLQLKSLVGEDASKSDR